MKKIVITESENDSVELKADRGLALSTFVVAIEILIEAILESGVDMSIDEILADVKRIYLRDKEENQWKTKKSK